MIEHIDKNKASLQVKDRFDFQGFLGNRYDSVYHFIKKNQKKHWQGYLLHDIFIKQSRWGVSSAGRAPALQAGGQRFDPVYLHHETYGQVKKQDERALRSFLILSFDNVFFNNSE